MKTFTVCVVERFYRWVEVQAEDESTAREMVWDQVDSLVGRDPEDSDCDVIVEGSEEISL